MIFYLGTHEPHWLARTDVPLFISRRRLEFYRNQPVALGPWALDSGGFGELDADGRWSITERQYVRQVALLIDRPGNLQWYAPMDWMCEERVLAKTGLSVSDHQKLTLENYLKLCDYFPEFPPIAVLQGWQPEDYMRHVEDYAAAGVDLTSLPLVGLGSVCRRQGTAEIESLVRVLYRRGLKLHAFGFKLRGLPGCADYLASADSMAWSYDARRAAPLPGCRHKNCANCLTYALLWRKKALAAAGMELAS